MTISCVIKVMRISLYLHVSAFLCISLHFTAFLCIPLHFSESLCISLHFSTFLCILHFTLQDNLTELTIVLWKPFFLILGEGVVGGAHAVEADVPEDQQDLAGGPFLPAMLEQV